MNLSAASLALLPVGSVIRVTIGDKPAVLMKARLGWGANLYQDREVVAMHPVLAVPVPASPVAVRTLPGFSRDTKARSATRRRQGGPANREAA